jgi:hypothetical protein
MVIDMRLALIFGLTLVLSTTVAQAQSLKPETPAPLQPGINKGTVDNFVGTHYWYFIANPGQCHVHAQFQPMSLLGNPYRATITITLSDGGHNWSTSKSLSSDNKIVDCTFDGDLKKPTKVLVTVAPPSGGLVRTGGDYQLEVTGPVSFGEKSNADPVIGMYKQMGGYTSLLGDCKFAADGTIQTTSGANGNWKLFDKDSQTYVIDIDGESRHSLQYIEGRGLCDNGMIIFQQIQ